MRPNKNPKGYLTRVLQTETPLCSGCTANTTSYGAVFRLFQPSVSPCRARTPKLSPESQSGASRRRGKRSKNFSRNRRASCPVVSSAAAQAPTGSQ